MPTLKLVVQSYSASFLVFSSYTILWDSWSKRAWSLSQFVPLAMCEGQTFLTIDNLHQKIFFFFPSVILPSFWMGRPFNATLMAFWKRPVSISFFWTFSSPSIGICWDSLILMRLINNSSKAGKKQTFLSHWFLYLLQYMKSKKKFPPFVPEYMPWLRASASNHHLKAQVSTTSDEGCFWARPGVNIWSMCTYHWPFDMQITTPTSPVKLIMLALQRVAR